jgi:hypothetical protein
MLCATGAVVLVIGATGAVLPTGVEPAVLPAGADPVAPAVGVEPAVPPVCVAPPAPAALPPLFFAVEDLPLLPLPWAALAAAALIGRMRFARAMAADVVTFIHSVSLVRAGRTGP